MNRIIFYIILCSWLGFPEVKAQPIFIIDQFRNLELDTNSFDQKISDSFTLDMVKWQAKLLTEFDIRLPELLSIQQVELLKTDALGEFYYYINKGDLNFFGFKGSSIDALQNYISALNHAESLDESPMICEALKRILDLYRYSYLTEDAKLKDYLDLYDEHAYDQFEKHYALYYRQILAFKHFRIDQWNEDSAIKLLDFTKSGRSYFLNARIYQLIASYFQSISKIDSAISYELQAIKSLKEVKYNYKSTLSKVSQINLMVYYSESGQRDKAKIKLSEFKLESRNKLEQDFNKYLFLRQSVLDTSQQDFKAAYYNLSNYLAIQELNAESRINDKIRDLEAQYQSEKKEQKILDSQNQIKSGNQLIKTVLVFVFILLILTFSLWKVSIKLKQRNKKIELLHRELHHRVKNNLQVISSLMGLQALKLRDDEAVKAIKEGKARVIAMSLIHEKLYQSGEIQTLNFEDYVFQLVKELSNSYGFTGDFKSLIHIDVKELNTEIALPIGLILNELVSNSFKHAFKPRNKAEIRITLTNENGNHLLDISDNGIGYDMDIKSESSFGMRIVHLLIKQLKGTLEVKNKEGLHYSIKF